MASLWRGRVSLLGRVYVLVAVLIVLLGVVTVSAIGLRQRAQTATTELTTEIVPAQLAVSELRVSYSGQASAVRGYLTIGDPVFVGAYTSRMADAARLEGLITQQMAAFPGVRSSLGEVGRAAQVWHQTSAAPTIELVRNQGSAALSHAQVLASSQRFEVVRAELAELQKRVNAIAASHTDKANAARAAANWLVTGAGLAGLVIAAGALFFLHRSLTRPVRTLVSQVNLVAEGNLDHQVDEVGPPELSTVARAVETMRRRIREETSRREQIQRDLAHHEAAERRRAEQGYATVITALDEGVIVLGSAGTVEAANPAARRILGITELELVGASPAAWPLFDETGTALRPEQQLAMPTQRTGQPENARVLRLAHPGGHNVWLSATSRALNPQEQPPHTVVVSFTDITESRAARQRLEYEATHDPLTGLANRTLVLQHCDGRPPTHPVAVLYLDLDNFKRINDSLGHSVGDDVLRSIGQRLQQATSEETLVGRLGGDEFVVLVPGEHNHDTLAAFSENLLDALAQPLQIQDRPLHVHSNVGIAVSLAGDPRTGQDLLRDADVAMYQAKTQSSTRFAFFDVELRTRVQRHMALEQDLRSALQHDQLADQLWVAYQPIVDLPAARTVAVEALLRWTHPTNGTIPPSEFIPIAEESDLINHLGAHMLRTATRHFAAERQRHDRPLILNANLSPRQLDDPHLSATVQHALATADLPAAALCLEITEEAIMHDPTQAAHVLHELRELGVGLAIDDFGTGHSSLAQLRRLPLDSLKIDRSFVTDLYDSADLEAIVTSIIAMAHALGLDTVAEGVETPEQLRLLTHLGCDQAQGYYLGKPATLHELQIPPP